MQIASIFPSIAGGVRGYPRNITISYSKTLFCTRGFYSAILHEIALCLVAMYEMKITNKLHKVKKGFSSLLLRGKPWLVPMMFVFLRFLKSGVVPSDNFQRLGYPAKDSIVPKGKI
jgi:hypothetical protein